MPLMEAPNNLDFVDKVLLFLLIFNEWHSTILKAVIDWYYSFRMFAALLGNRLISLGYMDVRLSH